MYGPGAVLTFATAAKRRLAAIVARTAARNPFLSMEC
jgi:hypothetical protein